MNPTTPRPACADPAVDPRLFDADNPADALAALQVCRKCPVNPKNCLDQVIGVNRLPHHYTGVAAGVLYVNGRRVEVKGAFEPLYRPEVCGTTEGRRFHRQHREPYCTACTRIRPKETAA